MKIKNRQLKRIIRETSARSVNDMAPRIRGEEEDARLMDTYSDIDDYFDGGYDKEDREWIVYSETSGRFEHSGISDPSELGKIKAYININGEAARQQYGSSMAASMMENKMKITKRQLRKIIKEEKARLREVSIHVDTDPAVEQIELILNDLSDQGLEQFDLIELLDQLIDDVKNGFIGKPV